VSGRNLLAEFVFGSGASGFYFFKLFFFRKFLNVVSVNFFASLKYAVAVFSEDCDYAGEKVATDIFLI